MTVALYTNSISAHQLPLAREIVKRVGAENYRYVYTGALQGGGQEIECTEPWIVRGACSFLEDCDILLSGNRALDLFLRRESRGLKTYYFSERWFKPVAIKILRWHVLLPGKIRMLVPSYRKMALSYVRWLNRDPNAYYFAIGPWARKDMISIGVKPEKICDWGYFVEPSKKPKTKSNLPLQLPANTKELRVLWVGRPLWWKRVDTIRKAVSLVPNATLDIFTNISIDQVREEMQKHDVYVLASNAMEGWGAALSEALEEGMCCFGTYEAGASAALLPKSQLFHCGDYVGLANLLSTISSSLSVRTRVSTLPQDYAPKGAAERILK